MSKEPKEAPNRITDLHTDNMRLIILITSCAILNDDQETDLPVKKGTDIGFVVAAVEKYFAPKTLEDIENIFARASLELDLIDLEEWEKAEKELDTDKSIYTLFKWAREHRKEFDKVAARASYLAKNILLFNLEIKKEEYAGKTLQELFDEGFEDDKPIPGSDIEKIIKVVLAQLKTDYQQELRPTIQRPENIVSFKMLNNKVSNSYLSLQDIFLSLDPDGQITMIPEISDPDYKQEVIVRHPVANKKTGKIIKQQVISLVSLNYYGDLSGKLARIKGYDQSVMNAVCSLVAAGNMIFTLEDIWYLLTQKDRRKNKPTKKQLERIKLSLHKYEGTKIEIDVSDELKEQLLTADGERIMPIIKENLLYFREFVGRTESGREIGAIQLIKTPILWEYSMAKANPQIVTLPIEWLQLGSSINATEDNIALRDYLLKEIRQMQTGNRDNYVINYDSLLKVIGIKMDDLDRRYKGKYTQLIGELLDAFRDKGIIAGWSQRNKSKNKVVGFEIIL